MRPEAKYDPAVQAVGVIAIATGLLPTAIGVPAVCVATVIGVTVPGVVS